jgi:hypothetical protein
VLEHVDGNNQRGLLSAERVQYIGDLGIATAPASERDLFCRDIEAARAESRAGRRRRVARRWRSRQASAN